MARITTKGKCVYCGKAFGKGGLKRHFASCQERQKTLAKQAKAKGARPARIFHLQVEGRYNPEYWMHLEMPADATLDDLDKFLRRIWLECCGHLSAFRIGKKSYDTSYGDDYGDAGWFVTPQMLTGDALPSNVIPLFGDKMTAPGITSPLDINPLVMPSDEKTVDSFMEDFLARYEGKTAGMTGEDLTRKFIEEFFVHADITLPGGEALFTNIIGMQTKMKTGRDPKDISADEFMQLMSEIDPVTDSFVDAIFDDFLGVGDEEGDINTPLGEALTVGDEFYHEYDFGSTTELKLKVLGERDGVIVGRNKKDYDPVTMLARNESPAVMCDDCGKKPAVWICTECAWNGGGWVCSDCAKQHDEEMLLPVVNSPRAGVCGYTGDTEAYPIDYDNDFVIYLRDNFDTANADPDDE